MGIASIKCAKKWLGLPVAINLWLQPIVSAAIIFTNLDQYLVIFVAIFSIATMLVMAKNTVATMVVHCMYTL